MKRNIIKAIDIVEQLLIDYPQLRDSDQLLYLAYMCSELGLQGCLGTENYNIFKSIWMDKDTLKFESISRARRKIQETNESLAGNRKRKKKAETEVRELFREMQ